MSFGSSVSKIAVLGVLSGTGFSRLKEFKFDGNTFSPEILGLLGLEIQAGTLDIMYETKKMGGKAIYNSTENRLYVGFWSAGTLTRQAVIVHELTHAMFDFQAKKMDVATSESIAYIAQCQYAMANSDSTDPEDRLYAAGDVDAADYELRDAVFVEGWRIAGKVLNGTALNADDAKKMRDAVSAHPEYAADATASAGYDGYFDRS